MNLTIDKFVDKGVLEKERVILKVSADDQLGDYVLLKTKMLEEKTVSNEVTHTYWFGDQEVKSGDLVVIYTKVGVDNSRKNESGNTSHFYYWNKTEPLWLDDADSLVVMKSLTWRFKTPKSAVLED
jgi:hypothetical protein